MWPSDCKVAHITSEGILYIRCKEELNATVIEGKKETLKNIIEFMIGKESVGWTVIEMKSRLI